MIEDRASVADMVMLILGMRITKMIEVAAILGLADLIDEEPRPVEDLSAPTGTNPAALRRLCRALVACGVFRLDEEGRLAHNGRSRWLRRDASPSLHYMSRYSGMPSTWGVWTRLEDVVREGEPAFERHFGKPYFDYMKDHPDEASIFDAHMQNSPDDRHAAVAEAYDFSDVGTVIDIGGGNGALLSAILTAYPSVRGVLFDHPDVVGKAFETFPFLEGRCELAPGDFFEAVTAGGDVYMLAQVLHDWSDERCVQILSNCRAVMHDKARLLVIDRIMDGIPDRTKALDYLTDLHMMVLFKEGRERTAEEFASLFECAGFQSPRIIPTRSAFFIVETMVKPTA